MIGFRKEAHMTWLFGDSSKSSLEINYIEFLRLAIDFSVEVLLAQEKMGEGRERRFRVEAGADEESARLEALGAAVARALEAEAKVGDSPTARCAGAIAHSTVAAVKVELGAVKSALAADLLKLDGEAMRERERCVKALEKLLLRHDLPHTKTTLQISTASPTSYAARLRGVAPFGLETLLELDIPPTNLFAHDVRVDRLIEGLEVKVPETGGWLRKQGRIVPHKLGKYRIAALASGNGEVVIELRASHDAHAAGFDVALSGGKAFIRSAPTGKDVEGQHVPFEPDATDTAKLCQLSDRLAGAVGELLHSRKALVEARLDTSPLAAHTHPAVLVERLVEAMTPSVQSIAHHSAAPGELVLRRMLAGDRREEVFVSKAELAYKLSPLPKPLRKVFEPLGFTDAIDPADGTPHPPLPGVRPTTEPVDFAMVVEEDSGPVTGPPKLPD
jgi:hypothetical protein